jgi:exonuclease III
MAWRPNDQLIEGVLDNTVLGRVTGWMRFAGLSEMVTFDLEGNFHRDIRGARVRLTGTGDSADIEKAVGYMEGFSQLQKGKTGDMTAGKEPVDYVDYPYFEWYSDENGRCVIELEPEQVELLSNPIPACESDPVSRKEQAENMAAFLSGMATELGIPSQNAISVGNTAAVEKAKCTLSNNRQRRMKLLTDEIRQTLPALYSQDGKGSKAVAYVKFFTPDSNWTWYAAEGEPVRDDSGAEVDFQFFGLVDGFEKELGYFNLSELEQARGPLNLPIERDLYWTPKTLKQIAPEMFKEE